MEIKPQNVSKMSNEQLYRLVMQKETSDADRAVVKEELVKREAEILYNQAKHARPGETTIAPAVRPAKGQLPWLGAKKKRTISLTQWLLFIFIAVVLVAVVYAAFIR